MFLMDFKITNSLKSVSQLSLTNITSEQSEMGKKITPNQHSMELFSLVKKLYNKVNYSC